MKSMTKNAWEHGLNGGPPSGGKRNPNPSKPSTIWSEQGEKTYSHQKYHFAHSSAHFYDDSLLLTMLQMRR